MSATPQQREVDRFFAALSARSRLKLYAAIFFLLAPIGLLATARIGDDRPPWALAGHVLLAGLAAVGWAAAFIHRLRLLFVVIPLHMAGYFLLERFDPSVPGPAGVLGIAFIGLGYVFFIGFISGEGVSKLRLQTEIALAQAIHRDLVPPIALTARGLDLFGRSSPSSAMGGDLLDVIERDRRAVACVADVSGHGVPAGVVMGMVKSALRTRLLGGDGEGPLLGDLDRVLAGMLRPGMFVTCLVVAVEEDSARYVNAGHLPLLRFDARSGRIERLAESGLPLGTGLSPREPGPPALPWRRFEFLPGDLLVLLTDGITEVFDTAGNQLGLEPIEAIVRSDPQAPLPAICDAIERAARAHGPQADDQTVLLVRRNRGEPD